MAQGGRLVLSRIDILSVAEKQHTKTQVKVVLCYSKLQFVGRSTVTEDDDYMIYAAASATLEAIKTILPPQISLTLLKASKLQPQFLDNPLLLALVDCKYEEYSTLLTGACITTDDRLLYGAAGAVLDATNRLISFVVDFSALKEAQSDRPKN
ncbi:MAG: hypothetical protein RMM17_03745 [Acidobacteriota bacterium]|nr:hypothetical protein [Blastocatellia bacterium]MDW8411782.1 hypothetical protein [Acidobacteriota bacterium]